MDFLLILLGILFVLIGFAPTAANDRAVSKWLRRFAFFAIGAALIIAGILFRMHRHHLLGSAPAISSESIDGHSTVVEYSGYDRIRL
jgi:hypothetical protein